jgi:hypothetical protein
MEITMNTSSRKYTCKHIMSKGKSKGKSCLVETTAKFIVNNLPYCTVHYPKHLEEFKEQTREIQMEGLFDAAEARFDELHDLLTDFVLERETIHIEVEERIRRVYQSVLEYLDEGKITWWEEILKLSSIAADAQDPRQECYGERMKAIQQKAIYLAEEKMGHAHVLLTHSALMSGTEAFIRHNGAAVSASEEILQLTQSLSSAKI